MAEIVLSEHAVVYPYLRSNYDAQHWTLRFPTVLIFYFFIYLFIFLHSSNSRQITAWSQFSRFLCQDPRNGKEGWKKKIWNIIRSKMLDNLNQSNLSFCHLKLLSMDIILRLSFKKKIGSMYLIFAVIIHCIFKIKK